MHWGELVQLLLCMHWGELVQLLMCMHWGEVVQLLLCMHWGEMHWGELVQCVNENNDGDAEAHDRFMRLHGHRWNWLHFLSVSVWCWWVLVKLWCDGQAQYEHLSMLSSSHCHVVHGRPNPHSPTPEFKAPVCHDPSVTGGSCRCDGVSWNAEQDNGRLYLSLRPKS